MGIQKDAEEILVYIYKIKLEGKEMPSKEEIIKITDWTEQRVRFALQYLLRKKLIYGEDVQLIGSSSEDIVDIHDITPDGIDIIENVDKFKKHFNHTIDLKIYKFSWGASEK